MEIVSVFCRNKKCPRKTFTLHPNRVAKYQRATKRFQQEAIDENVLDNTPVRTLEKKFKRIFNTSGSKDSINRRKHKLADQIEFQDVIPLLGFSGILCVDEFKPKGSRKFNLMASDFKTNRILFAMRVARRDGAYAVMFLKKLKNWGINPYLVMVDRLAAFSAAIRQVFPKAIIQYDYYHVIADIYDCLKKALKGYVEELKSQGRDQAAKQLNKQRFLVIKKKVNMKRKEKAALTSLCKKYPDSVIPVVVALKEKIFDMFDNSKDYETARDKRDQLLYSKETKGRFKEYSELKPVKTMLEGFEFYRMTAYLRDKSLPRSSNSERMMREYRRMEKVRYGFGNQRTRENHLKIYQIRKYLNMDLEEFILTYAKKSARPS